MAIEILRKEIPVARISQDHPSTIERQREQERGSRGFQRIWKLRSSGYQRIEQPMVTGEYGQFLGILTSM